MKIIFVDDDINLGNFISNVLETDYNYSVHFQNTTLGIIHVIEDFVPNIVILDVEIGEKNGIDTAKNIIANYPQIPILFVSSHTEEEMITKGINVGGNAYIPKPISIPILVSYIKRFTSQKQSKAFVFTSDYKLNLNTNELFYKNILVKRLSPFEKKTLELLMKNPNQIMRQNQIAEKLWGSTQKQNISSLQNTLSSLRELFKENNSIEIDTIRGVGYMLNV
ncbi:response regulator transcription factor [Ancylomarina sp. 16SWW S1-10-2]|uniref:response regulator transcription factor n=1 Tax=Ancylomarina sp. 16SWW S1-10-2 TaxID=2499681 RepID=UPI0012ADF755|nr:response regulator transcription factor [Ancylomarina sp. 16SWW S1-10-2]MRT93371.1 response regulator transcription factor [Ancylomarina sp. 16SWW S1-10-2]